MGSPKLYPQRKFAPGKSPLQKRSLHHNCKLGDFKTMLDAVGEEVYNDVMNNSGVGVILKLASQRFIWSGYTVHHFLTNQLQIDKLYEMWSLVGGRPVRFSLHEFEEVTKMKCDQFDENDDWDIDHSEFWNEMGVKRMDGPTWDELLTVFDNCRTWSAEKRKWVALLFILHVGVFGIARNSRIPLKAAKRVMDREAFEKYPWGRVSFKHLMESLRVANLGGSTYTVHGCVPALLVWVFEAIPILGEKFGNRREGTVPLLCWESSRTRYNLEKVLEEDKESNGNKKIRVRHLVVKPLAEIYPPWDDKEDTKLDNMVHDILGGCLDESFWELKSPIANNKKDKEKAYVAEKKKEHEMECEDVDMSINLRDIAKKTKLPERRSGEGPPMKKKKTVVKYLSASPSVEEVLPVNKGEESGEILSLLRQLMGKFDGLESRVVSLEGNRLKATEELVDEQSKVDFLDNASGDKDLSWLVEHQGTSQPKIMNKNAKVKPKIEPITVLPPPTQKDQVKKLSKHVGHQKKESVMV